MEAIQRTPSDKGACQNRPPNHTRKPVTISKELLDSMVNVLPERAKQGRRTIHKLGVHPDSRTGRVNPFAGVNMSDIRQLYNRYIQPFGYEIKCRKPDKPILDADVSGQMLWGVV